MTLRMFFTLVFFHVLALQLCNAQANLSEKEKVVLQTENKILHAVLKTDTSTVSSLLATDYTYTLPDGKIVTKKQYISDIAIWWRPLSIEHSEQKVNTYNKTAIVIGKAKYRWRNSKNEVEEAVEQYTDTYVRRKGKWIRVSSHASCLSGRCT